MIWTLIALASVIGLLSILTTWVNRQMLDNASWQKASTQVIQDPEVQDALSVYLVNQLYDNVDVAGALQQRLPPNLQGLAAPLAGALQQPATDAVGRMLARPRVQQLFVNASVVAHEKLVNVLENKTGHGISTGGGVVTLDLGQLVTELGTELGVPADALAKIPPNTGVVTVMTSDQLSTAQASVQALRVLSVWLLVIVLVMFGVALYLAKGIRREMLRNIGWAFVIVGLITLVVRQVAGNYAISALTNPPYDKPAHDVFLIASSTLGDIGWAAIIYGAVAIVGAVLAGPSRYATEARRYIAPVLSERQGHGLARRRDRLPPPRPLGPDTRIAHCLGRPAARCAARARDLGLPAGDAARVSTGVVGRAPSGALRWPRRPQRRGRPTRPRSNGAVRISTAAWTGSSGRTRARARARRSARTGVSSEPTASCTQSS